MKIQDDIHNSNTVKLRNVRQQWMILSSSHSQGDLINELLNRLKNILQCASCGESHPAILDFHHTDPATKDFAISDAKSGKFIKLLNEAEKCMVLCSNCHRKHHYESK